MDLGDVNRVSLHDQVWREPMIKVAAKYGVSSSYLARVCAMLGVPRPERGHWAKIAAGKVVRISPLPDAKPEHDLVWSRSGNPERTKKFITPKPYRSSGTRVARKQPTELPAYSGEREHSFWLNVNTFFLNASPTEGFTSGVHVQSIS